MAKSVVVGIADMKICRAPDSLITYALGSCIGIVLYDPVLKLAGMVHIMLPHVLTEPADNIYKYADTGISELLRKMEVFGGVKARLIAKIAGGAKMFEVKEDSVFGTIGARNIENVRMILNSLGIRITGSEVGENYARTMIFDADQGKAYIRTITRGEKVF